jgi:hypothetical protein
MLHFGRRRALILVLFLSFLMPDAARSHHGDETGNLGNLGNGFAVESGAMIELGHDESPVHILVGATLPGWTRETVDHHLSYRYFWVSFRVFTPLTGPEAGRLPVVGVNITPVSRVESSHHGTAWSVRFAPMEIRRDLGSAIDWSASVQAIGMAFSVDRPLVGEYSEEQKARFEKFARIAVDLLGLRLAQSTDQDLFTGFQIGSVQVLGGLRWNLNEQASLALAVGVRGGGAIGGSERTPNFGSVSMFEIDTFLQIQLLLQKAFIPLQLRLEGGYHLFGLTSQGDPHGHPYLAISAATWF